MSKIVAVCDAYILQNKKTVRFLNDKLAEAGFNLADVTLLPSIEEHVENITSGQIKADAEDFLLDDLQNMSDLKFIIVFGNNALCAIGITKKAAGIKSHRGKPHMVLNDSVPCMPTVSPNLVIKEPMLTADFMSDLKAAYKFSQGEFEVETPVEIVDILCPDDVDRLYDEACNNGYCAYDFESTSLNRDKLEVVTASFCVGRNEKGILRCYVWVGFDCLKPLFSDADMKAFKKKFFRFFKAAGTKFDLIAWNEQYDDWVAETWLYGSPPERHWYKDRLPGSTYDGMLMKYCYCTDPPHDLKSATARYLGFPQYDAKFVDEVRKVKARRGRVLNPTTSEGEADLYVLEWLGVKPDITERQLKSGEVKRTYKWPKKVEKGECAYAMVPKEFLRQYNALDSSYTYMLWEYFMERIEPENLVLSATLRHAIDKKLMRTDQRGMVLDVACNREMSRKLTHCIKECQTKLETEWDLPLKKKEFSSDEIALKLYGKVQIAPIINRKPLYYKYDKESVDSICNEIETDYYGDFTDTREVMRQGLFDYGTAQDTLENAFVEAVGSPVRLKFDRKPLGLGGLGYDPVTLTKTGKPSCSKISLIALNEIKHTDFLNLILMFRKAAKLKSTFVDGLYEKKDEFGCIRTSYKTTGTTTGRISSSGMFNAQNWPKGIRGQVIPRKDHVFLDFDLKNAEVRVLAAFANDPYLLKAIYSLDTHRMVAALIFDKDEADVTALERDIGKIAVFLTIFQGGADKLAKLFNLTVDRAQWVMDMLKEKLAGVGDWMDGQVELAKTPPHFVYTAFGTRRSVLDILSEDNKISSKASRVAINTPIQGSSGELMLYFLNQIVDKGEARGFGEGMHIIATVHDSGTLEVHKDLIWKENEHEEEKAGKMVYTYTCAGPVVELAQSVIGQEVPIHPLNRVKFAADFEINESWGGTPNLDKALDGKTKEEAFKWELIKPYETLTPAELREYEEDEDADVDLQVA